MSDLSPVFIAVCGLSIVCVGLVAIGGFLLARFAGINVIGPILATVLNRDSEGGEATPQESPAPRPAARAPRNLRGKAESLDFDAAVAKYQQEGGKPSADRSRKPGTRASRRALSDDKEDPSSGSLRRRRSREDDHAIYDDDDGS